MHNITLDSETDFAGWRDAARALALNNVKPSEVTWTVKGRTGERFAARSSPPLQTPHGTFNVPAKFVELAQSAILHRDGERFAILYRLLWRLKNDHDLLESIGDTDVARVMAMASAVHHDMQRMQTSLRFREIGRDQKSHFVAWFEPEHHIVEAAAPFFAHRYADMPWSILTPEVCAHWDGHLVSFTPGVDEQDAPTDHRLEETWGRYCASIFDPARPAKASAETSRKYWRNPPDASMIEPEIAGAAKPQRAEPPMRRSAAASADDLEALRDEAASCRACPLWENATQTVFGEGPQHARIMLVGEQPGDKEDLSGKPFVGPAGTMLDRALEEAGIDRKKTYVTNAVKHFKFVPRGKIRLHQKPNTPEIKACRQWYERELALIRPDLVVAMGATAAQCVLGKITPVNRNRGRLIDLSNAIRAIVTVHPSYLLRLPDPESREREYRRFVDDLKIAAVALKSTRAA